jgi:hypothetical protein
VRWQTVHVLKEEHTLNKYDQKRKSSDKQISLLVLLALFFLWNPSNNAAQTHNQQDGQQTTEAIPSPSWTSDQCVDNSKTWFRSYARDRKKLSHSVLAGRMQAMSKYDGRQDISREDQWYILQAESSYMSELLIRHMHYLQRHNQHDQFLNEDEAGER